MATLLVRHKVKNYSAWKKVFDDFVSVRRAGGEKSYQIFHTETDPNNLLLTFQWDSLNNAKKFAGSSVLKEAMQKAGVIEEPKIDFLNEIDRGTT